MHHMSFYVGIPAVRWKSVKLINVVHVGFRALGCLIATYGVNASPRARTNAEQARSQQRIAVCCDVCKCACELCVQYI